MFTLSPAERIARARADLRAGVPVVLVADGGRWLALAAETARDDRLSALSGAEVALTAWRAATLKIAAYDGDLVRIAMPGGSTAAWVAALADPALDLAHPMRGPFTSHREGSALAHRAAIHLAKAAHLLPAAVLAPFEGAAGDLTVLDAAETLIAVTAAPVMQDVACARLPLSVSEAGRLHVFRPADGGEEHYAVEIGRPARNTPVLCRLHSACFTGDVLGSLKCDCGPQLNAALAAMAAEGGGVLLYLNQEGRGIGLANKMRAYALQNQGFDTVEANHRLGFEDEERDFRIGTALLKRLGFGAVRLMTNNPAKVAMMTAQGIEVAERVPLKVGENPRNAAYLATKAAKSGHLL